jgi:hypothetical protein
MAKANTVTEQTADAPTPRAVAWAVKSLEIEMGLTRRVA